MQYNRISPAVLFRNSTQPSTSRMVSGWSTRWLNLGDSEDTAEKIPLRGPNSKKQKHICSQTRN